MKRTRVLNVLMLWSICSLAAATPARAQQNWTSDDERRRFVGDPKALKRELKTAKEEVLRGWDAIKSSGSSSENRDGYPAIRFRFEIA